MDKTPKNFSRDDERVLSILEKAKAIPLFVRPQIAELVKVSGSLIEAILKATSANESDLPGA